LPRARLVLVALCALFLGTALALISNPAPAAALTNCDTGSEALDSAELEMLRLVNEARAAVGSAQLAVSPNLNRAAAWKSEDAGSNGSQGFSHTDSLKRSPYVRAQDCGYPSGAAENIAYGFGSAAATFQAFMGSSGHRANIENGSYVVIGIGSNGVAWTLNFGFADDSGQPVSSGGAIQPAATPTQPPPTQSVPHTATPRPATPAPTQAPPAPQPHSVSVVLPAGSTLVTFAAPTMRAEDATESLGGALRAVYWWDASNGTWLHYFPDAPEYANTLKSLQPGLAYYVSVSFPVTWTY
jgi:hypothetical protein